jgi:uncharacterized protein (TIGR03032 family)
MSEEKKENKMEGLSFTRLFASFFQSEKCSLALACNLPAGLSIVGRQKEGKVLFQQVGQGDMCAVAAGSDGNLWSAEKNFLWKWENITATGGYKANDGILYAPRLRIFTSDLGTRDMAVDGKGELLMACGAYSAVGRASNDASFEVVWKPPFITKMVREDRCGLSGIGLFDKERHCVTMWGRSDKADGWRENFNGGGCVTLMHDSSIYGEGLCLPRAPRWRGTDLHLLNAGTAEFGKIDPASKRFVPVCQCPGYPTGLSFSGRWAVISISAEPPEGTAGLDLPAKEIFAARKAPAFSGILLVDMMTGDIAHHAYSESDKFFVHGVAVVAGAPLAMALGPESEKLDPLVTVPRRAR